MTSLANTSLEDRFETIFKSLFPELEIVKQQMFRDTGRRFVYDFYVPRYNVLFEINGGTWQRGNSGHSSGKGIERDYRKSNLIQSHGYTCFNLSKEMIDAAYIKDLMDTLINRS